MPGGNLDSGFGLLLVEEERFVRSGLFAERVYRIVARIPAGRVTTYGRIALAAGDPRGARMVGWALRGEVAARDLPCQRVVNHSGYLSGGWAFGHPDVMQALLVAEGVPFRAEYTVDLARCVWDPADELDDIAAPDLLPAGGPLPAADEVDDLDDIASGEDPG